MRALWMEAPGVVSVVERPDPRPGPHDLVVGVGLLGLCGTDLGLFDGTSTYLHDGYQTYPFVPGHEWTGTVLDVGSALTSVREEWVGRRVAGHNVRPCGACARCRAQKITHCPNRSEVGVLGDVPGAGSEFLVAPVDSVVVIPDAMSDAAAALLEPTAAAMHAVSRADVVPGERVAVIGAGTLGLAAAQIAVAHGGEVLVVDPHAGPRALAASLGLVAVAAPDDAHAASFDVVVEASGAGPALATAIALVDSGARIAQVGTPHGLVDGVPVADLVIREINVLGVLSGVGHWAGLVDLVATGAVNLDALVDRVVALDDVGAAFARLGDPTRERPKVLLDLTDRRSTDALPERGTNP